MVPGAELIYVALDVPSAVEARQLMSPLDGAARCYKVGLELSSAEGPGFVTELKDKSYKVFLDLKLHDIPNTVGRAARQLGRLGVDMFTIHSAGGIAMMEAACQGAREGADETGKDRPIVLAVTVLTSWGEGPWEEEAGSSFDIDEAILHRARLAARAGVDGLVCSPPDLPALTKEFGDKFVYVCPGIRPGGAAEADDHGRPGTPAGAVAAGADFLVVGRPITRSDDPRTAFEAIAAEAAGASGASGAGGLR